MTGEGLIGKPLVKTILFSDILLQVVTLISPASTTVMGMKGLMSPL